MNAEALAAALSSRLPGLMAGLWRASWQASALVGAVLLVQFVLGKRLGGRGRYALWSIVVLRLLLPVLPASPTSIYTVLQWPTRAPASVSVPAQSLESPPSTDSPHPTVSTVLPTASEISKPIRSAASHPTPSLRASSFIVPGLAMLWLLGALAIAARIMIECRRFARVTRRLSQTDDPELLAMVRDCAAALRVRRRVRVLVGDAISTP